MGVSAALTLFVRATSASHARLTEHVTRYHEILRVSGQASGWNLATTEGLATIEREIDRQAAMFGYASDFQLLAVAALAGLPLLLLLGRQRQSADPLDPPEAA